MSNDRARDVVREIFKDCVISYRGKDAASHIENAIRLIEEFAARERGIGSADDTNELFGISQMMNEGLEERHRLEEIIRDSQIAADCVIRPTRELPLAISELKQRADADESALRASEERNRELQDTCSKVQKMRDELVSESRELQKSVCQIAAFLDGNGDVAEIAARRLRAALPQGPSKQISPNSEMKGTL